MSNLLKINECEFLCKIASSLRLSVILEAIFRFDEEVKVLNCIKFSNFYLICGQVVHHKSQVTKCLIKSHLFAQQLH